MNSAPEYETHISVGPTGRNSIEDLQLWAAARGLKCVHIVLDGGDSPSQPMLTRHGHSNLQSELEHAHQIGQDMASAGFSVTRVKIEAAPWNEEVPHSDEEAQQATGQYFEHHIKLLLGAQAEIADVASVALKHGARLSRNARRARDDGHERFVTQRCFGVGRGIAWQRFQELREALASLGHPVLEEEEEFVVYDSNLALDAGWIE
jgi:hypothetical protein